MMPREQIEQWLQTLAPGEGVAIDDSEGGLRLMAELGDAWLDVGGFPDDDAVGDKHSRRVRPHRPPYEL